MAENEKTCHNCKHIKKYQELVGVNFGPTILTICAADTDDEGEGIVGLKEVSDFYGASYCAFFEVEDGE